MKSFINHIKDIRNEISHGKKVTFGSDKVAEYYNKALLILLSCILKNLKYTNDDIKNMLLETSSCLERIYYLKGLKK